MDSLDFGVAGALIMLTFGFLVSIIKTFLVFVIAYYFSKIITPITARKLNITQELNVASKQYAISFLTSWLFIVPLTFELITFSPYIGQSDFTNTFNIIDFYYFYLIGFTLFTYDKDLNRIELKPFRKTIITILIYFFINIIHNLMFAQFSGIWYSSGFISLQYFLIKPILFGIITIGLIKRNNNNA